LITKRDGRKVEFDGNKIRIAVAKAYWDPDYAPEKPFPPYVEDIVTYIEEENEAYDITVEEIQDIVEEFLMKYDPKTARKYVRYRYRKEVIREQKDDFYMRLKDKIEATNVQNQNANVDEYSFGGRKGETDSAIMKEYALTYCVSDMARENHEGNMIYIHDLDAYAVGMHNCLTIPFDDLLAKGFNTRQTDVRPARSINTAFQLIAVIFQLQSLQQFGGVSASHLDWTMVPYVRRSFFKHYNDGWHYLRKSWDEDLIFNPDEPIDAKSYKDCAEVYQYALDMTERELRQAVEGMYHNLNTLQSRSGNQLPFTSINYGTCTLPEGRMVIKALLEGSIKGVGKLHRTPIFPCGIFQMMKGVNREPNDPNYDLYRLALKSTAKRLYPNYANVDWSGNAGYDRSDPRTYFSTMGCRTANGMDINGLGQLKDGRGNICPVTIILPTLAMMAKDAVKAGPGGDVDGKSEDLFEIFMAILDKKIEEAKDMLIERFEYICKQDPRSAQFMYENNTMAGYVPEEGIRSALKHGTIVIGQLGLAETLEILIGTNHCHPKGMEYAKKIEQLFKDRCAQYKQQYKLNFGVYYTPAENLCYTAMKKFRSRYGTIKHVSDHEYFTNSIHVPVWEKVGPLEKIEIEAQLTGYSSAGCITYVELETGIENNLDAMEQIVNYAMDHDIPYFAINVPNDTCLECGYTGEFNDSCPVCGSPHIQQLRRVTGYLTGNYKTAFNWGKQKETEERIKHTGRMET
jgi:ribonucleoside-triphosphate reductase